MNNLNNWQRLLINPCRCGCGAMVAKNYKKGHGRRRAVRERLEERVQVASNGCWIWTGAQDPAGYGRIGIGDTTFMAHRISHELYIGPIPAGLHVDHLCRITACVNPDHLEAVTQAENNRRAARNRKQVPA